MVVDVSYHNGSIDWGKAKAAGVKGAIIRCGYGSDKTRYDDSKYHANMQGALANGIKVGVYLYSYAKSAEGARSEAAHAIRLIAPYKSSISLPIYYDLEEAGTEPYAKSNALIFGEILDKAGYEVGIYASEYWWKTYLKGLDKYTKWIAKWGSIEPKGFSNMEMWQYDAYGKVSGIGSGVDMDKPFGRLADIINGVEPTPDHGGKVMVELEILRKGSKGTEVFTVQSILKAKGYKGENGKVLALDESFGGNTEYAVKAFQKDNRLTVDGVVGQNTWNKLLKG